MTSPILRASALAILSFSVVGCGGESGEEAGAAGSAGTACSRFVTGATEHSFGGGQNIGQSSFPAPILGPPKGTGDVTGSLDVVSIGNGGTVTLEFGDTGIIDEPGPDFIVFENAFFASGDPRSEE